MTDGQIAMEHHVVMGPQIADWRDPDNVPDEEVKACIKRIRAAHDADLKKDLREMPEAWADFCQFTAYVWLWQAKERERKNLAMMEISTPETGRPN